MKELSPGEVSAWKNKLNRRSGKDAKEGHLQNSNDFSLFLGLPNVFHISEVKGIGYCVVYF